MLVDVSKWEMHNMVKRGAEMRTRKGLVSLKTPTASTYYVGGFSVESPQTSEVFHYLFEQDGAGVVTLRVFTEEYFELYTYPLGQMTRDPIITFSVQNNQGMISSPSFSGPLYFYVGGGCIAMTKTPSINNDTLALEPPRGHCASFGDRFAVAQGPIVYFNDPGVDPKTFVAESAISLPGSIFDLFQGGAGELLLFTSGGLFSIPSDALGQGQSVVGFISKIPGIETSKPRNAACSNGTTAILQRDSVITVDGKKLVDTRFSGRRYYSREVAIEDLRQVGEIFATSTGFVVGFRQRRGFFIDIDMRERTFSYVWIASSSVQVVGTLRSRDGETLLILRDRVVQYLGNADYTGTIRGVLCGRLDIPEDKAGVVRRVTVSSANAGEANAVSLNGTAVSKTTPTRDDDFVLGTDLWATTTPLRGRALRTVRHSFGKRESDPAVEVVVDGGDRRLEAKIAVEVTGQGQDRRDKS